MEDKIFRYSIKAIIIKDNKLLVESCDYGRGRFTKLPGGGHQWGETMQQALVREVKEELGIDAKVKRLLLARDYIAKNHNSPIDDPCFHQSELMFECEVDDYSTLGTGTELDEEGQEIKWLDIETLENTDFVPKAIIPFIRDMKNIKETIVLGDVN